MEEEVNSDLGVTRRGFLAALGLGALSFMFPRIVSGGNKVDNTFEYVKHKGELALRIPVRNNDNYYTLAELYTNNENNGSKLQAFNDNNKLRTDRPAYIPERLLRESLKKVIGNVLYKKQFVVYVIAKWGDEGVNSLWELIHDFMIETELFNFKEKMAISLILNPEIDLKTTILQDGQKIIVPSALVKHELEEEPRIKPKVPIPHIKPSGTGHQNPFRTSRQHLLNNLRPRDKYGAPRSRSSGRNRWPSRHKGIDLAAPIGTPLYPIQSGKLISLGKEPKKELWRNGIIAEYLTASGVTVKYCHLSWVNKKLRPGMQISLNTLLGKVGISGNAEKHNPHVHVGVRIGGETRDPYPHVVIDS